MLLNKFLSSAIVFATIGLSSSIGFTQEFYQQVETYTQPYTSYQVESGHYISEPFTDSDFTDSDFTTSDFTTTEVSTYGASTATTETHGGFTVVQQGGFQAGAVQGTVVGSVVESNIVYGEAIYVDGVQGQGMAETIISPDYGYEGPGDMRTHLWNDHGKDLEANGVSKSQLDAMSMESVQKWHNFFHGSEGRPAS